MEQLIYIFINLVLFLVASYIIFYRKYLEALGTQTAEVKFLKQKTLEIETVKSAFSEQLEFYKKQVQIDIANEVEPLRASLSRENITFQIYSAEYIKLRFQRIDELYGKLYELKKYCEHNLFPYLDEEDFTKKRIMFNELYKSAEDALYRSAMYIENSVKDSVFNLLNETYIAQFSLQVFHNTVPQQNDPALQNQTDSYYRALIKQNSESFEQLHNSINKLPSILNNIEMEFKRHLTLN